MVLLIVLGSWAGAAVLFAVLFAAIGRSARREDEALGYLEPDAPTVPVDRTVPIDDPTVPVDRTVPIDRTVPEDRVDALPKAVTNSASR